MSNRHQPTPTPTWAQTLEQALKDLGGEAHLRDIYAFVKANRKPLSKTFEATVRRTLQQDDRFTQGGTRSGVWRLATPDDSSTPSAWDVGDPDHFHNVVNEAIELWDAPTITAILDEVQDRHEEPLPADARDVVIALIKEHPDMKRFVGVVKDWPTAL